MTKKIDSFQLKLLAITGMLINHMGIVFEWSRSMPTLPLFAISEFVGKFTFPIMAYLLVEGYHYTRDVKKYALGRILGALHLPLLPAASPGLRLLPDGCPEQYLLHPSFC